MYSLIFVICCFVHKKQAVVRGQSYWNTPELVFCITDFLFCLLMCMLYNRVLWTDEFFPPLCLLHAGKCSQPTLCLVEAGKRWGKKKKKKYIKEKMVPLLHYKCATSKSCPSETYWSWVVKSTEPTCCLQRKEAVCHGNCKTRCIAVS